MSRTNNKACQGRRRVPACMRPLRLVKKKKKKTCAPARSRLNERLAFLERDLEVASISMTKAMPAATKATNNDLTPSEECLKSESRLR